MRKNSLSALPISLVLLSLVFGCATYPSQENPKIPAAEDQLFAACVADESDGVFALQAYENTDLLVTSEVEWISDADSWTLQMINPLGQTMVSMSYGSDGIDTRGMLVKKIPPLGIDKDGFLTVDSHFVALRATEIPCFLQGVLPKQWVDDLKAVVRDENKHRMWFDDSHRIINVVTNRKKDAIRRYCTQIMWGNFLTRQTLLLCRDLSGDRKASLSGIGDYKLEWTPL